MGGRGTMMRGWLRGFPSRTQIREARTAQQAADEAVLRDVVGRAGRANASKSSTKYLYGDMATLLQVREALDDLGWSRERQDTELRRMLTDRKAWLVPHTSAGRLSPEQWKASLRFGNQRMFLIKFLSSGELS